MSELSPFELEGRINGLKEVLAIVVGHLVKNGADDLKAALEDRLTVVDQQEDPGAVMQSSFAAEAAAAREIQSLVEHALGRTQEPAGTRQRADAGPGQEAHRTRDDPE